MVTLTYDLHIHSCLSPCGDEDMTPGNIAGMAVVNGLDVIALTDHNSCKNCPAFMKIAADYGILALPGMELTTQEEAHVVCLLARLSDAMAFDAYVEKQLIPFPNNEEIFGRQIIRNEADEICGSVENLLLAIFVLVVILAVKHTCKGFLGSSAILVGVEALRLLIGQDRAEKKE